MIQSTTCPGCGLRSREAGIDPDRRVNASSACWGAHAELVGFELAHVAVLGGLHQVTVDAYGAQHAAPDGAGIRTAYSLVGLCLALERGWTGVRVRDLHARMGRPQPWWPTFPPPTARGALTVMDVVEAGARAGSVEGHARLVDEWSRAVWLAWGPTQPAIRAFTGEVLRGSTPPG